MTVSKSYIQQGDSRILVAQLEAESIHLIVSDIPYGIGAEDWDVLHANTNSAYLGSSPGQTKAGSVFKKRGKQINGWSEADRRIPHEYYEWCMTWAPDWYNVLKPGASVFIFAGRRLAHRCISAMEDSGFTFKDSIAWIKPKAAHRAQRISVVYERRDDKQSAAEWSGWKVGNLRPIYEPILWFTKPYKMGTTIADNTLAFGVGAYNEAAFKKYVASPDNVIAAGMEKAEAGLRPTQKPIKLMSALIELASKPGQTVLDPFVGSGTTVVAAALLGRIGIGFESSPEYCHIAKERLANIERQLTLGELCKSN